VAAFLSGLVLGAFAFAVLVVLAINVNTTRGGDA
jgi:hypothetical protein